MSYVSESDIQLAGRALGRTIGVCMTMYKQFFHSLQAIVHSLMFSNRQSEILSDAFD